jgi:hypothetical protein
VFDDEDPNMGMKKRDVRKEISKIREAINKLSAQVLVVTSIQAEVVDTQN